MRRAAPKSPVVSLLAADAAVGFHQGRCWSRPAAAVGPTATRPRGTTPNNEIRKPKSENRRNAENLLTKPEGMPKSENQVVAYRRWLSRGDRTTGSLRI